MKKFDFTGQNIEVNGDLYLLIKLTFPDNSKVKPFISLKATATPIKTPIKNKKK